jgi:hypothetical protein
MLDAPELKLFAVLDGASVPNLPQELYQHEPDYLCLYRGALDPDLAETAPYLVRLEPGSPFAEWIFNEGWGKHWGIFFTATCDMRDLRSHFRKFLIVYDAGGKPLYFRYYDPRVLRVYLPTCRPDASRFWNRLSVQKCERKVFRSRLLNACRMLRKKSSSSLMLSTLMAWLTVASVAGSGRFRWGRWRSPTGR